MSKILLCLAFIYYSTNTLGQTKTDSIKVDGFVQQFISKGDTLEGLLEIPQLAGQRPLVVFVHGSGRVDRSDYYFYVDKFWKAGYATFRYDKRGVGASGGDFLRINEYTSAASLPQLAADAHAAVELLSKNQRIDSKKILLMGNSQAGWIIPVAANLGGVSGVIIVSGPAVTVGEEMHYSRLVEQTKDNYTNEQVNEFLKAYNGEQGFDPVPHLSALKVPSLWIIGGKDRSIPSAKTIEILESIKEENKLRLTIKPFEEADHSLRNTKTGQWEDLFGCVFSWLTDNG